MGVTSASDGDLTSGHKFPDMQYAEQIVAVSYEDTLRANVYGLLARLLTEPPSDETIQIVRGMAQTGDGTEIGNALSNLRAVAETMSRGQVEDEFTRLFYGHGAGGEITPTASFYLTGFINEKPLASLRRDLMELGVSVSGLNKEPEDHIAFLCEVMHGLISGTLSEGVGLIRQRAFFHKHIMSWGSRIFQDLEGAEAAVFYMPVGTIGKLFMALECEAFEMAA